jgi:transcription elongation factor GreA
MNQPIFLTKTAFNLLLSNLLKVEEGTNEIIDGFFGKRSKETEELKQLLNEYVRLLDSVLPNITTVTTAANYFPYVVVGGEVIVEDAGSGETCCYKLVSPLKNNIGFHEISFLSPMGKALMLKKVNDRFIVEAPGGNYEYKVLSIRITV